MSEKSSGPKLGYFGNKRISPFHERGSLPFKRLLDGENLHSLLVIQFEEFVLIQVYLLEDQQYLWTNRNGREGRGLSRSVTRREKRGD